MSPKAPPSSKKTAIIIAIGNEILDGHTLDTNSHYLAGLLRENGVSCLAIHAIRDEKEQIKDYMKMALDEGADYVFFSGGLGPTHDDITFESIAEALQRRLVLSGKAVENIQIRLDAINAMLPDDKKFEMNDSSKKMAMVPEGTQVLSNRAGTAPAVAVRVGGAHLFLMPGVPHELRWIVENEILGSFIKGSVADHVVEIPIMRGESSFALALSKIQGCHPEVKIGSYPQPGRILLRLAGEEEEVERAAAKIREHIIGKNGNEMNKRSE